MSNNGTDRDVAMEILNVLSGISSALSTINSNLYVPHITTQPTDVTVASGEYAEFTVVATNVKSYQWQFKNTAASNPRWENGAQQGYNTATYRIAANSSRYAHLYRCEITGLDDSIIYTDEVKMIAPET